MKFTICIFSVLVSFNAKSAEMCSAKNSTLDFLTPIDETVKNGLKLANIQYAKSNMKDFCQRNMLLRYINVNNNAPKDCDQKTTAELEELAIDTFDSKYTFDVNTQAWELGLIPTEASTRKALEATFQKYDFSKMKLKDPLDRFLKNLDNFPTSYNEDQKKVIRENLAKMKNDKINDEKVSNVIRNVKITAACSELSVLKSLSCTSATESLINRISPKLTEAKLTNLELWEDVLLNDKYDIGIKKAAAKIISHLKGSIDKKDNIFKDFTDSFIESGMSAVEAKIASIKVLGLISNGANNTSARIMKLRGTLDQHNKDTSLSLIATSLQFLDYKKSEKGQPLYSMPDNVKSNCLYSKYHHFWMSAYLGWMMVNEMKIDPKVAAMSVFTVEKGYQVNRDIGRPNSEKVGTTSAVLSKNPYDPIHQVIRVDLAFSSAGAFWGANNFNKKIDVDSTIVKLLQVSKPQNALSKEESSNMSQLEQYNYWSSIFAPNSAFENIDAQK